MLLLESALFIAVGVEGLGDGIEVVGELEGLVEEKVMGRRFFLSKPPTGGALSGSSSGVNGVMSGVKILKLFLRLLDMLVNIYSCHCQLNSTDKHLSIPPGAHIHNLPSSHDNPSIRASIRRIYIVVFEFPRITLSVT